MNMDRKALVAVVVCIIFYIGYTKYLSHKYPNMGASKEVPSEVVQPTSDNKELPPSTATAPAGDVKAPTDEQQVAQLPADQLRFETADAVYEFDQEISALKSVRLKKYRAQKDSPAEDWVELFSSPMVIQGTRDIAQIHGQRGYQAEREGNMLAFSKRQGDWLMRQTFTIPKEGYEVGIKVEFQNLAPTAQELTGGLWVEENIVLPPAVGFSLIPGTFQQNNFVVGVEESREAIDFRKHCEDTEGAKAFNFQDEKIDFVGFDSHYFLNVFQPRAEKVSVSMGKSQPLKADICPMVINVFQRFGMVNPNESVALSFSGYFGPKDTKVLAKHDPALKHAVDFGWFSIIARPLLAAIQAIYKFTHNYGVAIIIVTVILKILFYPLTRAAAVSMKRMQKLNPEMQRIRERFKDDRQRQQQELMQFMAKNKVNPAKGCLPILPQIPVFIAFYNVLSNAIELRHSEFFGWIQDLSVADPYYIMPILLGVGMFVQQKLTPNPSMDKSQERIMLMMPVIFTVMMLSLPAGLVLYMIANTVVSIGQQQWLNKRLKV